MNQKTYRREELMQKFWAAETTREEEAWLFDEIQEEDDALAIYSNYIRDTRQMKMSEGTDEKILSLIQQQQSTSERKSRLVKLRPYFYSVAAALLALVVVFMLTKSPEQQQTAHVPMDEETRIAYEQVKSALLLVSNNINQGIGSTLYLGEFHTATEQMKFGAIN